MREAREKDRELQSAKQKIIALSLTADHLRHLNARAATPLQTTAAPANALGTPRVPPPPRRISDADSPVIPGAFPSAIPRHPLQNQPQLTPCLVARSSPQSTSQPMPQPATQPTLQSATHALGRHSSRLVKRLQLDSSLHEWMYNTVQVQKQPYTLWEDLLNQRGDLDAVDSSLLYTCMLMDSGLFSALL